MKDIYIPNLFSRNLKVFLPNFFCTQTFWKFPFQYALLNRAACLFLLLPTLPEGLKEEEFFSW